MAAYLNSKHIIWQTAALLGLLLISLEDVNASEVPSVEIRKVEAHGSGCLTNQVAATISPDGKSFSLIFDNYIVESDHQRTLERKNCEVMLDLHVGDGWSYSIISADYRGFASVDPFSIAMHQVLYSFDRKGPINEAPGYENGIGRYSFKQKEFRGPFSDNYYVHDEIDSRIAPWSSCSRNRSHTFFANIFLTARTQTRSEVSRSMIVLDSMDGSAFVQRFGVAWRKCNSGNEGGGIRPPPRPPRRPPPKVVPPSRQQPRPLWLPDEMKKIPIVLGSN